jgi:hypothetical protein
MGGSSEGLCTHIRPTGNLGSEGCGNLRPKLATKGDRIRRPSDFLKRFVREPIQMPTKTHGSKFQAGGLTLTHLLTTYGCTACAAMAHQS